MDDEIFAAEVEDALSEISRTRMPFGKYGPENFPPSGIPIYDLPWDYLHWFSRQRGGFPPGQIGQLLETVYHMKSDGSDEIFDVFRRRAGGRAALRKKRPRSLP
ncbi:MAG: hypothetical protein ACI8UO_004045 [Verrucomicrobiales bacterium]|jgi:uncharacterized protein (DUF3820 family)